MSVDEWCQVKCCERHLMCFISVCLNCPGTLESLSVSQIRCNETRLLSSEDTCLSAVTQANAGEKGLSEPFEAPALYFYIHDSAPLCIRNCSCRIISLQDPPGPQTLEVRTEVTLWSLLKHLDFSGIKLLNEVAIWI